MITTDFLTLVMKSLFSETQLIYLATKKENSDGSITYENTVSSDKTTVKGSFSGNTWQTVASTTYPGKFPENTTEKEKQVDGLIFCKNNLNDSRYVLTFDESVSIPTSHLLKINGYSASPARGIKISLSENSDSA
jgi:hypothetical protein